MTDNINEQQIKNKIKVSIMRNIVTAEEIKAHLNSNYTKTKSMNELFDAISAKIDKIYNHQHARKESRQAARNFISFCQLIVDHKIKIKKEKDATKETNNHDDK